jgi:hypothetical protein
MALFLKTFAKRHSCPSCEQKVKRVPLAFGKSVFLEIIFWVCYGIAFLIVGFFVQALGGSQFMASSIALVLVSFIAIPIHFSQSSFRCTSCDKTYDFSEVKSHGWFQT